MYFTKLVRQCSIAEFDWNLLAEYRWFTIVNLDGLAEYVVPSTINVLKAMAGQSTDTLVILCEPGGDATVEHLGVLERLGIIVEADTSRPFMFVVQTTIFTRAADELDYTFRYLDARDSAAGQDPNDVVLTAFDDTMNGLRQSSQQTRRLKGMMASFKDLVVQIAAEYLKHPAQGTGFL